MLVEMPNELAQGRKFDVEAFRSRARRKQKRFNDDRGDSVVVFCGLTGDGPETTGRVSVGCLPPGSSSAKIEVKRQLLWRSCI